MTEGEGEGEDAVPGWRQPLEALSSCADPAEVEVEQVSQKPKEAEGFGDMATSGKVWYPLYLLLLMMWVLLLPLFFCSSWW